MLIDAGNSFFEIDARADGAKNLVAGAENTFKKMELLSKELVNSLISCVLFIEKIHHNHIVLLPVAVAATDALLDALGIPREIVVDDQRAELQVDTFRPGLGGNHDTAFIAEVIDQS